MHESDNHEAKPFDLKLAAVSFLAGALFVLPAYLFMCHQCQQHVQTETRLRNQLLAEHYNNQAVLPPPATVSHVNGYYIYIAPNMLPMRWEDGGTTMRVPKYPRSTPGRRPPPSKP